VDVAVDSVVQGTGRSRVERGQTMVEFALVMPVLVLFLFAIVELGSTLNAYLEVKDAARVGARRASELRQDSSGIAQTVAAAKDSTAHLDEDALAVDVTVRPWPKGAPIEVRVAYPVSIDILGVVVSSFSLEAKATARSQ